MNRTIQRLRNRVGRLVAPSSHVATEDLRLIAAIRSRRLTYLSEVRLRNIACACRGIEAQNLPGCFIEAGCALGGSTILISKLKSSGRPLIVYDVFGMIPPPTKEDGPDVQRRYEDIESGHSTGLGADEYYGYQFDLYEKVRQNIRSFGLDPDGGSIRLVKGRLQETMRVGQPVAFAHIDVDWYEPVRTSLERIVPRLEVGGAILLDDYSDWSGCRKATDEYFQGRLDRFSFDLSSGAMKVQRMVAD